ncbi:hypothetical protein DNTS_035493 [Danionella cerebrum]|uniref:MENTAL domain-containing protein n=1 Tax=Danionella cerebrum TaxID=2873325 RepID=A0A553R697_9TELE|nr:hypothetical protein DNTS_035493 [Danionella translucida]
MSLEVCVQSQSLLKSESEWSSIQHPDSQRWKTASAAVVGMENIISTPISARVESYEAGEKKCISDVRRTFCLFVTFDLLFVTLLWIIELNVNGGIKEQLVKEVVNYDYHQSFFDIFLLAVFRFAALILAYAVCRLRHWWAIALLSQGAFGYLLPIVSFILAWIETWLLDFKVLPQEAGDEIRYLSVQNRMEHEPLLPPGPLSEGQFYSPPESPADSDDELDDKHDLEKPIELVINIVKEPNGCLKLGQCVSSRANGVLYSPPLTPRVALTWTCLYTQALTFYVTCSNVSGFINSRQLVSA